MANKSTYMPKPGAFNTPLQQLATKRNWDKLQIKGSTGQLRTQILNAALPSVTRSYMLMQLNAMEDQLIEALDKKWKHDKVVFAMQVQEEAFGKEEVKKQAPLPVEEAEFLAKTEERKAKAKAKRDKIKQAADDF